MTECMCTNMKWILKCWVCIRESNVDKFWWGFMFWFGAILPYLERIVSTKTIMNVTFMYFGSLRITSTGVKIFFKPRFFLGAVTNFMTNYFKIFPFDKRIRKLIIPVELFMWQKHESMPSSPIPKRLPHLNYLIYVAFQVFFKLQIGYSNC